MLKFKEFLRECLLNERKDYLYPSTVKSRVSDYRHSIGLPDEDEIPDVVSTDYFSRDPYLRSLGTTKGTERSVEDEARRRIAIEDDLMSSDDPLVLQSINTDTSRERHDKLSNKIIKHISDITFEGDPNRYERKNNNEYSLQKIGFDALDQRLRAKNRLQATMDNIVNDRKTQFPDLAKEQEKLTDTEEKLKTKEKVVSTLLDKIPDEAPIGTTKIVNYLKNFIGTIHSGVMSDLFQNSDKQEEMPWSKVYGTGLDQRIHMGGRSSDPIEPYKTKPEFEQTRTFTADPALALPQENEQGIRLGRVDYSRKNK